MRTSSEAVQRGQALRHFRCDVRHWTQTQLARSARVSLNTISRVERRGVRNPTVYLKIRRALGISETDVQQWIAARPLDTRLTDVVRWFDDLPPPDQDQVARFLQVVFRPKRTA